MSQPLMDLRDGFNPRPREEGDDTGLDIAGCLAVSIHALAKRATAGRQRLSAGRSVSIHALAKRATPYPQSPTPARSRFNPRPREEGDTEACSSALRHVVFQSTPSMPMGASGWTNSTSPSSRGRGLKLHEEIAGIAITNVALFARAWIETTRPPLGPPGGPVALFARAWIETPEEGDVRDCNTRDLFVQFQSTPSRRGRQALQAARAAGVWFQSTPSRRGRPSCPLLMLHQAGFQSTPSRRGRRRTCGR